MPTDSLPDRLRSSLFLRQETASRLRFANRRNVNLLLAGGVTALFGVGYLLISDLPDPARTTIWAARICAGLALLSGLMFVGYAFTRESLVLDKQKRTLSYSYRSAFEHYTWTCDFSDICEVRLQLVANINRRALVWRFSLVTADGHELPVQPASLWHLGKDDEDRAQHFADMLGQTVGAPVATSRYGQSRDLL